MLISFLLKILIMIRHGAKGKFGGGINSWGLCKLIREY
jgi:hypothetical protein